MLKSVITQELVEDYWKDKRVLITGGTAGLGKSLALKISKLGGRVAVIARSQDKIDDLLNQNSDIIAVKADVSDKEAIYKISGQVIAQLGGIDILVNNASSLGRTPLKSLIETECEDLTDVLETNLVGPFRLTKAVLPNMLTNGTGLIINISSDAAVSSYGTWGSYSVSKSALDHLTRIWQEELKDQGIQFLALDPGDMATNMHFEAIPDADPNSLYQPQKVANDLATFLAVVDGDLDEVRFSASEWRVFLR